jgi:hypothetical protein
MKKRPPSLDDFEREMCSRRLTRPVPAADKSGGPRVQEPQDQRHPEDVGRTVEDFNWVLRSIVR